MSVKSSLAENDYRTNGFDPVPVLLRLAAPIIGALALEVAYNFVDGVWVGRVGTDAFAAINLASFSIWTLHSLSGIVSTGTNAVVAQKVGAGDRRAACNAASHGIALGAVLGLFLALPVTIWGHGLLSLMAGPSEQVALAVELAYGYLAIVFLFAPVYCLLEAMAAVLRAYGDTRSPALIYTGGLVLNLILDPFLIFGWGPFPKWGVLGAAVATVTSFTLALSVCLAWARSGRLIFQLPDDRPALCVRTLKRIVAVGLPPSLANVIFCVVYMAVSPVVGRYGPAALAALGIGHRILSISYLVCEGISVAAITVVGQAVGGDSLEEAVRSGWAAVKVVAWISGGLSCLFFGGAVPLSAIFSSDPAVKEIAVGYLRIISFSQPFLGIAMALDGVFAGFGKTVVPTKISIVTTLMRLPGVYWVGIFWALSVNMVWLVLSVLTALRGVLALWAYRNLVARINY